MDNWKIILASGSKKKEEQNEWNDVREVTIESNVRKSW